MVLESGIGAWLAVLVEVLWILINWTAPIRWTQKIPGAVTALYLGLSGVGWLFAFVWIIYYICCSRSGRLGTLRVLLCFGIVAVVVGGSLGVAALWATLKYHAVRLCEADRPVSECRSRIPAIVLTIFASFYPLRRALLCVQEDFRGLAFHNAKLNELASRAEARLRERDSVQCSLMGPPPPGVRW
jgi:hypothetical protein